MHRISLRGRKEISDPGGNAVDTGNPFRATLFANEMATRPSVSKMCTPGRKTNVISLQESLGQYNQCIPGGGIVNVNVLLIRKCT